MEHKKEMSDKTKATSKKLGDFHKIENTTIMAITIVVMRSIAVTRSGNVGPLIKRYSTSIALAANTTITTVRMISIKFIIIILYSRMRITRRSNPFFNSFANIALSPS